MSSPVEIVDYDSEWPRTFRELEERLSPALADLPVEIEHVGSTAVPGLASKPIIDIDIVVERADDIPRVIERLAGLGYEHQGDLGVIGREAFGQPVGLADHHLYAVARGNSVHRNHIGLRDRFRERPDLAARYGALKFELAKQYGTDRDGYTQAKSEFIDEVLRQAEAGDRAKRYPMLSSIQEAIWGSATMRLVFEPEPAVPELISNVRCAAFVDDRVIVIDSEEFGLSAFPGGLLEPGESWMDALERELLEETGARPLSVQVVGRIHYWSGFDAPYRPHLPHPEFQQVVTYAQVEVVGSPTNPPDGERVVSVELVPVDEAIERLKGPNEFESELLRFVADERASR